MQIYVASLGICEGCGALLTLDAKISLFECLRDGVCFYCGIKLGPDSFGVRPVAGGYEKLRWVVRDGLNMSLYKWGDKKPEHEFILRDFWVVPNGGTHDAEISPKRQAGKEQREAAVFSFDPSQKNSSLDTAIATAVFFKKTDLRLATCQPWVEVVDKDEHPRGYSLHRNSELYNAFISEMEMGRSSYKPKGSPYLCMVDEKTFEEVCRLGNGFFVTSGGLPPRYTSPKKTNVVHVRFGK